MRRNSPAAAQRADRLAVSLKANLHRRKAQARARAAEGDRPEPHASTPVTKSPRPA